jgi:hypothetical protein
VSKFLISVSNAGESHAGVPVLVISFCQTMRKAFLLIGLFLFVYSTAFKSSAKEDTTVFDACADMIPAGTEGYDLETALVYCEYKQEVFDKRAKKKLDSLKKSWQLSNNTKMCNDWGKIWLEEYPVRGIVESEVELGAYSQEGCKSSRLYLVCESGSCFVAFNSRPHGFFPGKLNRASIDGKIWSWQGNPSKAIGHQMWKAIKDKSSVALELVLWPYSNIRPFKYSIAIPKGLKNKVYQASLQKSL